MSSPSSARTQCPYCHSYRIEALPDVLHVSKADYIRCKDCRRQWSVPRGEEGPPDPAPERGSTN
jgi:transposase-like protein